MASRTSEASVGIMARARELFPGGVNSPVRAFNGVGGEPFVVDRGEGARIWDVDGNEYIDYVLSWGPLVLGHAPAVVLDALRETMARGTSFGIPTGLEVTSIKELRNSSSPIRTLAASMRAPSVEPASPNPRADALDRNSRPSPAAAFAQRKIPAAPVSRTNVRGLLPFTDASSSMPWEGPGRGVQRFSRKR